MAFGDADLPYLFETGVDVTLGSTTVKGFRDTATEELLRGEGAAIHSDVVFVTVRKGALSGLVPGAALTVDGEALQVIGVERVDDGSLVRARCAKHL